MSLALQVLPDQLLMDAEQCSMAALVRTSLLGEANGGTAVAARPQRKAAPPLPQRPAAAPAAAAAPAEDYRAKTKRLLDPKIFNEPPASLSQQAAPAPAPAASGTPSFWERVKTGAAKGAETGAGVGEKLGAGVGSAVGKVGGALSGQGAAGGGVGGGAIGGAIGAKAGKYVGGALGAAKGALGIDQKSAKPKTPNAMAAGMEAAKKINADKKPEPHADPSDPSTHGETEVEGIGTAKTEGGRHIPKGAQKVDPQNPNHGHIHPGLAALGAIMHPGGGIWVPTVHLQQATQMQHGHMGVPTPAAAGAPSGGAAPAAAAPAGGAVNVAGMFGGGQQPSAAPGGEAAAPAPTTTAAVGTAPAPAPAAPPTVDTPTPGAAGTLAPAPAAAAAAPAQTRTPSKPKPKAKKPAKPAPKAPEAEKPAKPAAKQPLEKKTPSKAKKGRKLPFGQAVVAQQKEVEATPGGASRKEREKMSLAQRKAVGRGKSEARKAAEERKTGKKAEPTTPEGKGLGDISARAAKLKRKPTLTEPKKAKAPEDEEIAGFLPPAAEKAKIAQPVETKTPVSAKAKRPESAKGKSGVREPRTPTRPGMAERSRIAATAREKKGSVAHLKASLPQDVHDKIQSSMQDFGKKMGLTSKQIKNTVKKIYDNAGSHAFKEHPHKKEHDADQHEKGSEEHKAATAAFDAVHKQRLDKKIAYIKRNLHKKLMKAEAQEGGARTTAALRKTKLKQPSRAFSHDATREAGQRLMPGMRERQHASYNPPLDDMIQEWI